MQGYIPVEGRREFASVLPLTLLLLLMIPSVIGQNLNETTIIIPPPSLENGCSSSSSNWIGQKVQLTFCSISNSLTSAFPSAPTWMILIILGLIAYIIMDTQPMIAWTFIVLILAYVYFMFAK